MSTSIDKYLTEYKTAVEHALKEKISCGDQENKLQQACGFALLNGGKRLRPVITLMVGEALGNEDVMESALACEMFHCASLVADDLPCMDDDALRRGKPSVHIVYGEAMSLLVTYALISAGYGALVDNVSKMKQGVLAPRADRVGILSLENVTYNTGLNGATGGQFLDIFPPDLSFSTVRKVIHQKTISLFEIAFVNGWLFGGGDIDKVNHIKLAASHFGMAFQIVDDLGDLKQDADHGRGINMAAIMGVEAAKKMVDEELKGYHQVLADLEIDSEKLMMLPESFVTR